MLWYLLIPVKPPFELPAVLPTEPRIEDADEESMNKLILDKVELPAEAKKKSDSDRRINL